MTSPIARAVTGADPTLARSPFAGLDLCRVIGLTVATGAHGPTFDQDIWDFNSVTDLAAYMAAPHKRWNLTAIRNPLWRIVAKEYLAALMLPTHDAVRELPSAFRVARTVPACVNKHYELIRWLNWLSDQGVTELGQLTDHLCESYIAYRRTGHDKDGAIIEKRGAVNGAAQVVAGLAQYRDLFTTDRYPQGFRPFGGKAAVAVAGLKTPGENSTPPVPNHVLQPMLAAALYVVDTLGPRVVELTRDIKAERARISHLPEPRSPGVGLLLRSIERRVAEGRPFTRIPVRVAPIIKYAVDESDPLREVSLREVATDAGYGHFRGEWLPALRPALERAVAHVGVEEPMGRDATPVARADGQGQTPWTVPLPERHARSLLDVVRTACLLVIAAATGMRSSEKRAELR
jgi:hypothetical protein